MMLLVHAKDGEADVNELFLPKEKDGETDVNEQFLSKPKDGETDVREQFLSKEKNVVSQQNEFSCTGSNSWENLIKNEKFICKLSAFEVAVLAKK